MPPPTEVDDSLPERTAANLPSLRQRRDMVCLFIIVVAGATLKADVPTTIAVGLIVLVTLMGVVSPAAATAAVAAAIPFGFHPVQIGNAQFSLLETALIVASFGVGADLARATLSGEARKSVRLLWGHWQASVLALLLVLLGAVSLLTVADPRHLAESVRELRLVVVEPVAALVLTRWSLRHDGGRLLVFGLLATGAVVALVSGFQVVLGRGEVIGNGVRRATGPYPHPNNLALYLERVGLFSGAIALAVPRLRRLALPVTVVIGLGLVATLSRGALLAILAGGGVALATVRPAQGWRRFGVASLLIVIVFAALAGDRLWATGTSGGTSTRELVWRSSLEMIRDHPVFGVGLDQFLYQYAPRYVLPAGWPERYTSHPHNLVLDVWLRLGVAGLAVFAGLAVCCVRWIGRLRNSDDRSERWGLAVAGAALLAGGVAHGMVDNGFFLPDLAVLTWIAVALIEPSSYRRPLTSGSPP